MSKFKLKTQKEIETIAEGGRILADVLQKTAALIGPGISTAELNRFAEDEVRKAGATPSFKGYGSRANPFPAGLCTSINDVVVHGIPDKRDILKEGDIVGIDLGVKYKGFFTDSAVTVPVGKVSPSVLRLIKCTREALDAAIAAALIGNRIGDISHAMQTTVEAAGFNVIRDLIGHGVGHAVHEEPAVPCYGRPGEGIRLEEGLVIAIEPMTTTGKWRLAPSESAEWPVRTADGSASAHFEHTVAVTAHGPRILTLPP